MMKKTILKSLALALMLGAGTPAAAQSGLGNILKSVATKAAAKKADSTKADTAKKADTSTGLLGGLLSGTKSSSTSGGLLSGLSSIFSSAFVATKDQIVGTWVYEEPAVVFSSDNTLTGIGGKLASSAIEKKLQEQLDKFGVAKGNMQMTFDKDGNFTQTYGGKTVKGTYTIEDKNVNLKYGGTVDQVIGTTQIVDGDLLIVMDATKLLGFAKTLGSLTGNSTLQAASSLLDNVEGMEVGLRLKKQ